MKTKKTYEGPPRRLKDRKFSCEKCEKKTNHKVNFLLHDKYVTKDAMCEECGSTRVLRIMSYKSYKKRK